jgi:DNA-binding response OmpR family regulator
MMPGMDGLEICRRTREVDRTLYAIMLTARGSTENVVEGLGAGADDYLVKPVDKDELHARILVGLRVMASQCESANRLKSVESEFATMNDRKFQFAI